MPLPAPESRVSRRLACAAVGAFLLPEPVFATARAPRPPVILTFPQAGTDGSVIFDVEVERRMAYAVRMSFHLADPQDPAWRESPGDSRRLNALLGGGRAVAPGTWEEPGVPASFRVQVSGGGATPVEVDSQVANPATLATARGRYAILATFDAGPGLYQVRVTTLRRDPALESLFSTVSFGRAHHGK